MSIRSSSVDRSQQPPFRMVRSGWASELRDGVRVGKGVLRIVCPFITERAVDWLLNQHLKLSEMMDTLQADSFVPTQQNAERGDGSNTSPRLSVRRQAAARLTDRSYRWLSKRPSKRMVGSRTPISPSGANRNSRLIGGPIRAIETRRQLGSQQFRSEVLRCIALGDRIKMTSGVEVAWCASDVMADQVAPDLCALDRRRRRAREPVRNPFGGNDFP